MRTFSLWCQAPPARRYNHQGDENKAFLNRPYFDNLLIYIRIILWHNSCLCKILMARSPRPIINDLPYHIICRVNNGEYVIKDEIAEMFVQHLRWCKDQIKFDLNNYSILPSHVHMIIKPSLHPINIIMHAINSPFSKIVNKKLNRKGHFWLDRYSSVLIKTDRQYLACMRYVDRNAYAAGLVRNPWDWKWSGTAHYATGSKNSLINNPTCYISLGKTEGERRNEYKTLLSMRLPMDNLPNELKKCLKLYFSNSYRSTF